MTFPYIYRFLIIYLIFTFLFMCLALASGKPNLSSDQDYPILIKKASQAIQLKKAKDCQQHEEKVELIEQLRKNFDEMNHHLEELAPDKMLSYPNILTNIDDEIAHLIDINIILYNCLKQATELVIKSNNLDGMLYDLYEESSISSSPPLKSSKLCVHKDTLDSDSASASKSSSDSPINSDNDSLLENNVSSRNDDLSQHTIEFLIQQELANQDKQSNQLNQQNNLLNESEASLILSNESDQSVSSQLNVVPPLILPIESVPAPIVDQLPNLELPFVVQNPNPIQPIFVPEHRDQPKPQTIISPIENSLPKPIQQNIPLFVPVIKTPEKPVQINEIPKKNEVAIVNPVVVIEKKPAIALPLVLPSQVQRLPIPPVRNRANSEPSNLKPQPNLVHPLEVPQMPIPVVRNRASSGTNQHIPNPNVIHPSQKPKVVIPPVRNNSATQQQTPKKEKKGFGKFHF